jgi:hypothetical protein
VVDSTSCYKDFDALVKYLAPVQTSGWKAPLSYDLTLFRIPEEVDPSVAHRAFVEQQEADTADLDSWMKRPIPEGTREEMRRIAGVLRVWRPSLEEFLPKSPLPWIELNDEDLQLQFCVYDGSVSVTMPYFRDRAEEMMACVTGCLAPLKAATGYSAYDPQLERVVSAADVDAMVAQYRGMDRLLPEILEEGRESLTAAKRPWWKFW